MLSRLRMSAQKIGMSPELYISFQSPSMIKPGLHLPTTLTLYLCPTATTAFCFSRICHTCSCVSVFALGIYLDALFEVIYIIFCSLLSSFCSNVPNHLLKYHPCYYSLFTYSAFFSSLCLLLCTILLSIYIKG